MMSAATGIRFCGFSSGQVHKNRKGLDWNDQHHANNGEKLMQAEDARLLEAATNDLIIAFDVTAPPVPVEIMLQRPKAGMWKEVNLSELSAAFINVKHRYSPRMSIA